MSCKIGMKPGGFDNAPLVQTLMNAVSPAGYTASGPEIVFPPALGQNQHLLLFLAAVRNRARLAHQLPGRMSLDSQGPVTLVFPPAWTGVQEWGSLTPDGGWGLSDISGCGIMSLGGGARAAR